MAVVRAAMRASGRARRANCIFGVGVKRFGCANGDEMCWDIFVILIAAEAVKCVCKVR